MISTQDRQSWFAERHETLLWLMANFPLAFFNGVKPLKIGIHQDIFNAEQEALNAKALRSRNNKKMTSRPPKHQKTDEQALKEGLPASGGSKTF